MSEPTKSVQNPCRICHSRPRIWCGHEVEEGGALWYGNDENGERIAVCDECYCTGNVPDCWKGQ